MLRKFVLLLSIAAAQRIISRTQIEVKGYSIEKVGMPHSLVPAGKGRFAYIEYWAQDKPKPGWYIECLNTEYYTQWSQWIDIPKAGEGRSLRLLGLKEAIVLLSYEEDPLTKGAIQEVARFYDLKGQLLLPKWTAISVYDRAVSNVTAGIKLAPDSTHFLWYAYQLSKKGIPERAWYAIWNQSGRKVSSATDWNLTGAPLAIALDARQGIWTVERNPNRPPSIVYYDTRARTRREWKFLIDTVLYAPSLQATSRAVYVAGFLSGEKTLPHTEGAVGRWVVGYLSLPLSDTSDFRWSVAPFPPEWYSLYKDPTSFTVREILSLADTALYVIWEDIRLRGGAALAYDLWVTRWRKEGDSLQYSWAYRIEKRQKEPDLRMVSYLRGVSETFLTIAFLTERTGKGKLIAYQINHHSGEAITKELAANTGGDLLILPMEAAYLGPREVVCLALAPPAKNGYQLFHIRL
ncbi:MAG: hypothetical protein NZ989_03060 [Bacteroidia bacterium]|nr:hypothetical protein [Bacteroidia bacterium]MDW8056909.1 hypothetical protein [Bacteroidia bacterium]